MADRKAALEKSPAPPRRLEVTLATLLQDWKGAHGRAQRYLAALEVDSGTRSALAAEAVEESVVREEWPADSNAYAETLRTVRREIVGEGEREADESKSFFQWRLARALGQSGEPPPTMPALARSSMAPHHIERRWFRRRLVSSRQGAPSPAERTAENGSRVPRAVRAGRLRLRWVQAAFRRRALLLLLVLIPSVIASGFMLQVLPYQGRTLLEAAIVLFFGALFGWISIGFWFALAGFFVLLFRRDRFSITAMLAETPAAIDPRARTAILMTICEEPVDRVFAGLRTMYRSLERTSTLPAFDFFVLSDTADPGTFVKEEEAWLDWCRSAGGFGRIFYRRRHARVKRKSGNIADFCRRFGHRYRYMVTLDADSLVAGETIVSLVRLMEANQAVGLIQTAPTPIHARSLYARIQEFAHRVYGPLFATGLHFWQLGDAQYWGHNAIVRIAPFMEHCSLPRLPGRPPLGGEILSHDFVEAAMLGRAGYSIWLAYDLPGSYEELPSSLLEDLHRDRRWCQGNFQHLRLVFVEGLFHVHRALFVNGVFSYVSALLWFCFLSLSTAEAILRVVREPDYFPSGPSLFPEWPIWRPDWALALLTVTLVILFLPKILSAVLVLVRGGAGAFGGVMRFLFSIMLEFIASSLFAPIRMLFHTKFVLTNLIGRIVAWRSPPRGEQETSWAEATRRHGLMTILGTVWGASVYWLNPAYFWWLTPIVGALIVSVPLSVLMSRVGLGQRARAIGLFLTPEETAPPRELAEIAGDIASALRKERELTPVERDGFVRAVVDPYVNALHRWLLRGPRSIRASVRERRRQLVERALGGGPAALGVRERRVLLMDSERVEELHRRVWELPSIDRARSWGRPGEPGTDR